MLSNSNIEKIRAELNKWSNPRNQGYRGMCLKFVGDIYRAAGLNISPNGGTCCSNANRDAHAQSGNPNNGDIVFSGTNYHNEACGICPREAGHTAIYLDGYAWGSQTTYKCDWNTWVSAFGYGGHTCYGNDYIEPPKTKRCIQNSYNGTEAQMWKLVPVGEYYKIVNKSGLCLDVKDGTTKPNLEDREIQAWRDNGTDAQLWTMIPLQIGGFMLASKINEGYVLDVQQSTIYKRAYMQLHHKQTTPDYQWAQAFESRKIKESSEYIALMNIHSMMVLDSNPTGIIL